MRLTLRKVCDAEYKAAARFPKHCPRCGAPTSVAAEAYCANSECRWNNHDDEAPACPPVSQESAPRSVTAPRAVKARGGTRRDTGRNRLAWVQIALHLEDRKVNP